MKTLLTQTIGRAVRRSNPGTTKRMRALAGVRWVLATDDGRFVTVNGRAIASLTREAARATVYDGRDNEVLKCRFMETLLRIPLTVVLIEDSFAPQ